MTTKKDLFEESLSMAAEECGASLTSEQINYLAEAVEGTHENMDMAFPSGPPDPGVGREREIRDLQRKLQDERDKVTCRECCGNGRITIPGPYHSSNSECWKCRGEGRHAP